MIFLFKKFKFIFLIVILSYWSIKPLFIPGFFPIHDDTQVARVFEMTKALKDGMFPVRWVSDLGYGYGYPIFNFYAPLSYYVGSFFNLLGFDSLVSLKIMIAIGIVMSAVFMYLLAKEFWGNYGALMSATLYLYAPFHALDIYVRGDISEVWAYGFIPLIFYGIVKTCKTKKFRYASIGSVAFACLVLSHNLTALMVAPFVLFGVLLYSFIAFREKKISTVYYLFFIVFNGLLLSAFYWIPALFEIQFTNVLSQIGGSADFRDHFVCIEQLWGSDWGFGGSIPGCIDGISFKIGKLHLILLCLAFIISLINLKRDEGKTLTVLIGVIFFIVSVFLLLSYSEIIWERITPMSFFQYPWRFLILCSFFSSFIGGYVIEYIGEFLKSLSFQKIYYPVIGIFVVMLVMTQSKHFVPQYVTSRFVSDYTNNTALLWITSKISDEYMPKNFKKPKNEKETVNPLLWLEGKDLKILSSFQKTQYKEAIVQSSKTVVTNVRIAYFPSWRLSIDNEEVPFRISNDGIKIGISKGKHVVRAQFKETEIEKISNIISLIGLFLFIPGIMNKRKSLS